MATAGIQPVRMSALNGGTSTGKVKLGVTPRAVNIALEKVIRILNLCAWK